MPQKNVRPLAGHPLLAYAIETARQSGCFERVVVSTDSEEIADETTTSAARDVVAGRRSELDAILGGVLRTAERLDVPCSTLTELAVAAGLR